MVEEEEVSEESELDLLLLVAGRDVTGDKELSLRGFESEQSSSEKDRRTKLLQRAIYI